MWRFRLIPDNTKIPFLRLRRTFFIVSITLAVLSVAVLLGRGLNFGIDFAGGILIEVGTEREADIGQMRSALTGLGLGEIALQEFGSPTEVLIRIERQPGDVGDADRLARLVRHRGAHAHRLAGARDAPRQAGAGPGQRAAALRR